jgi:hypothetical protein
MINCKQAVKLTKPRKAKYLSPTMQRWPKTKAVRNNPTLASSEPSASQRNTKPETTNEKKRRLAHLRVDNPRIIFEDLSGSAEVEIAKSIPLCTCAKVN